MNPWVAPFLGSCFMSTLSLGSAAQEFQPIFDLKVEAFESLFSVRKDSAFNPGNEFAQLPQRQFDVQLRPKLAASIDGFKAWVSPRWVRRSETINGDGTADTVNYAQDYGVQ